MPECGGRSNGWRVGLFSGLFCAAARTAPPPLAHHSLVKSGTKTMKIVILLIIVALAGGIVLFTSRSNSGDSRNAFARSVVDALAADNWQRSALKPYLCDDRPKDSIDKSGISFDQYPDFDGIKAVGKIRLIPVAAPPAMAMDTFIPVLFKKQFAPFPAMPDHIAYHATYIQLQTQKTSDGMACLEGWGRNDIPVNPDQTDDFLNYRGIFNHD